MLAILKTINKGLQLNKNKNNNRVIYSLKRKKHTWCTLSER